MKVVKEFKAPEAKFDLYFMAYDSPGAVSHGKDAIDREGVIELTHNYGTEDDPSYMVNNGNKEPHRGFGHTCISVDNIQAACKRIEDAGYKFQKKLTDGRMNHIAFALDPDGYWVEIIGQRPVEETAEVTTTDVTTYRMVCPLQPRRPGMRLTLTEPHHDPRQGRAKVAQVLPGRAGHVAGANARGGQRGLQPLLPGVPERAAAAHRGQHGAARGPVGADVELRHGKGRVVQVPQRQRGATGLWAYL